MRYKTFTNISSSPQETIVRPLLTRGTPDECLLNSRCYIRQWPRAHALVASARLLERVDVGPKGFPGLLVSQ